MRTEIWAELKENHFELLEKIAKEMSLFYCDHCEDFQGTTAMGGLTLYDQHDCVECGSELTS